MKKVGLIGFLVTVLTIAGAKIAEAHEAYVLPSKFFWTEIAKPFSLDSFAALENGHNIFVVSIITICIIAVFTLNFFFRRSRFGRKIHSWIEKCSPLGPLFVRATIALSFFFSALSGSFLGPELPLTQMPFAHVLQASLFVISVCVMFGIFTEIAALAALAIFCLGLWQFGLYVVTYLNYLGEIIVLLLFGARKWSVDRLWFGPLKRFPRLKKYETSIVRICYGIALAFAAVTVKLLHPALTLEVVNHWNLTQFHWLFPSDPLLVTLGAGLTELAIGFFIIIGFELRLIILISLFYITLSLFFFGESVWPHLLLYGISLNLLVQPEFFTVDHLLFKD